METGRCLPDDDVLRFLSGEIDETRRAAVERHLEGCESCTRLVGEVARETGSFDAFAPGRLRPSVLAPGALVASRYHVLRLLGTGAMGEVHEVEDRLLDEIVALKTLNARLADDPSALPRLKAEAAAARRVTHRNVCRVFDLGVEWRHGDLGALVFLTMERLQGETLACALDSRGRLPVEEALPLLEQIAEALAAAHAVGVVHRDLKPANVMLVSQPGQPRRAVVTDFGLARSLSAASAETAGRPAFVGTLAYAAPEQLAGGVPTPASDVYSFGVLAREVLTGLRPADRRGTPPTCDVPGLPPAWRRALDRAIAQDPARRPTDGPSLVAALRGAGGVARGTARRWPATRAAGAVLGGLAVALSVAWSLRHGAGDHSAAATAIVRPSVAPVTGGVVSPDPQCGTSALTCGPTDAPSHTRLARGSERRRVHAVATPAAPDTGEAVVEDAPVAPDSPRVERDGDLVREEELLRTIAFPHTDQSVSRRRVGNGPELVNPFGHRPRTVSDLR